MRFRVAVALAASRMRVAFVAVLALLFVAVPAIADAGFSSAATRSQSISTDTIAPPTNVRVTCSGNKATVTWTITTAVYAAGYIYYSKVGSTENSQSVSGRTTATLKPPTISTPTGAIVTMVSVYRNWTSVRSAAFTVPTGCK